MLKMTGIELGLILDIYKHLFIDKEMRGGISYFVRRYSKANHKYMKDYDSSKESIFIVYLNANNLYGSAMTKYLPYGRFKWLSQKQITHFDVNSISENTF